MFLPSVGFAADPSPAIARFVRLQIGDERIPASAVGEGFPAIDHDQVMIKAGGLLVDVEAALLAVIDGALVQKLGVLVEGTLGDARLVEVLDLIIVQIA